MILGFMAPFVGLLPPVLTRVPIGFLRLLSQKRKHRTQCVQEIGRKRAKILVKYDDALGRRAKVMIGKSQNRLHRHRPSLAKALST
jgi:hypothetical protein